MSATSSEFERPNREVRVALLEAAARLIASQGPASLTLRRVADEVGTSTMAIYTHFGGMPQLRRAVRREGFRRLAERLAAVEVAGDPVAELSLRGVAYYLNAIENRDLYRVMFMEQPIDPAEGLMIWDTFEWLVDNVRRCTAAGRFKALEPRSVATELWALAHGVVSLQLVQLLSPEQALTCLDSAGRELFVSYSTDPDATRQSLERARQRAQLLVQGG